MSKTYFEMNNQYEALTKTIETMGKKKQEIIDLYKKSNKGNITFIGCGSGYCLCQSGSLSARVRLGVKSDAFAAGDLLLNYEKYSKAIDDSLFIVPSRSGSTSEVILAINKIREGKSVPIISITCVEGSDLSKISDCVIELPWAFDESVCQTRAVTNLYAAQLLLIAYISGDTKLEESVKLAASIGQEYMSKNESVLKNIAEQNWENVAILADGEMQGIASEGAMAFVEIAQINASYYHLLDVRHGPMVLVNGKTLVVMCVQKENFEYQKALINDIVNRGATVVVYSDEVIEDMNDKVTVINSGVSLDDAVRGIPYIYILQALAYFKAEKLGLDIDNPDGIVAWVKL